ncbi:MAG: 3-dehydroquinate synthase [Finegoldia sp.]|nr:3-dehydroquinate synthase [Finegoldia sp.]
MQKIRVQASTSYDILIEKGLRRKIKDLLPRKEDTRYLILTDDKVERLHYRELAGDLQASGYEIIKYRVRQGEGSKSMETLKSLLEFMACNNINLSDILIAFGGGVIGDLGGFAAGIYRRGIDYIQVPTTLLAQVDSSVGGKTAVNLDQGKNMVGVFKQPLAVFCDPDYLKTLDERDFCCGLAEVIKYGVLFDRELFDKLKAGVDKDMDLDEVIKSSIEHKRDVVQEDELDKGQRQLLNLGHTVGHAIEILSDHALNHGEGVAIGIAVMARACKESGILSETYENEIEKALVNNHLPIETSYKAKELMEIIKRDKKRRGSYINEILVDEVGRCHLEKFDFKSLENFIGRGLK